MTLTLGVGAEALALASSRLALSYSLFSLSSLTAASQISSEFGLAWKARDRIPRAAGTSPMGNTNPLTRWILKFYLCLFHYCSYHMGYEKSSQSHFILSSSSPQT